MKNIKLLIIYTFLSSLVFFIECLFTVSVDKHVNKVLVFNFKKNKKYIPTLVYVQINGCFSHQLKYFSSLF